MARPHRALPATVAHREADSVMLAGQDIVCFAGEDWWFHNPHSNLHIMQAWSKRNRILFVNSPGIRMPNFKNDNFAFKRVFKKLRSLARFLKLAEPNLWVFTPLAIPMVPRFQHAIARFNNVALRLQMRYLMRRLAFERPIVWVTVLVAKDVAIGMRAHGGRCLVYYCVDNTPQYPGVDHAYMSALEDELNRSADLAFFTNQTLLEERAHFNARTYYTGHGVDYAHFARAQVRTLAVPEDIAAIAGPIAGYMGEINSLDLELLRFLARAHPGVSFVFIGDLFTDLGTLSECDNVHFLGKKPYAELPRYLQCFDVCCLYYKTETTFNNYRNPKKLLEYLATGKPVVSVSILEVRRFAEHVRVASTYEQYSTLLSQALTADTPEQRERRIAFAARQTWEGVAATIGDRIAAIVDAPIPA